MKLAKAQKRQFATRWNAAEGIVEMAVEISSGRHPLGPEVFAPQHDVVLTCTPFEGNHDWIDHVFQITRSIRCFVYRMAGVDLRILGKNRGGGCFHRLQVACVKAL